MNPNKPPSELRKALADLRPYFVRAGWFSLLSSLLVLAPSGYMLEVYDRVVNSRSHMTLWMLTLLVLGVYVVMEVLEWARAEMLRAASVELDQRLSGRIFRAVFEANLKRIQGGNQQPFNDFKQVREFLYSPALLAMMEAPVSIVFLVLLFLISPVLGWSSVAFSVVLTLVGWLNERSTKPPLMAANRSAMAAQQYADGSLRNAQVIESMGMLRDIHARWMSKQREFLNLQAKASESAGGYQAVSKMLQNVLSSLLLGLACWLLLHNSLNGGDAMLIIASVLGGRVLAPLVQVVTQWQSVVNVRASWERLEQLLEAIPARPENMALPAPRGLLQVEQLMAGAPGAGNNSILKGVAFALAPGEVLAVVGPSASGKTTLARLLVGLWPAAMGKVRLDGVDVFAWDKAELGPHVGYLPQGIELFDGSLAENIARFGEVDMAKVEAAARAVGLHEFIMALPQGYDSSVGREGAMLSGGQRQRVGLARAIYGDPVFVVLDEPNSSLDEEGDAALARAIAGLKARGTTFVVMTHRTSVLAVADKMLILRDGQVQAFGPRDEVLAALQKAAQQQQAPAQARPANAVVTAA
ncbi:MAG: type I secretion system permease/ATPase [Giesbergeria sp.]|uniref:type I secretion system permease/ATPase n=1 Tax=Giesbergeria sp. TaxID=2818473 RepID=UPI00260778FE|nr:type I secretion system permease/ATPase [Giesbergeria sp.]MDD2609553.1 type I secretion system permease/ATPase [Giesbergeria sp.]